MIGVISVFGLQSIQDELKRRIKNQDILFMCDDRINGISAVEELDRYRDSADVIILNHSMIKNLEAALSDIRKISKTVRVILILNGLRKQYTKTQLEAYRIQYRVEDVIFEGGGLDVMELLSMINKGRLTEESIAEQIKPRMVVRPKPKESIKTNSIESVKAESEVKTIELDIPEEFEAEKVKPSVMEKKPEKLQRTVKQKKTKLARQKRGFSCNTHKTERVCRSIAVFGVTHGAGATNMVTTLAEFLSLSGKKVIALNLSGGTEFQYVKGKAEYKDMKLTETGGEGIVNAQIYGEEYDIILIDLGTPFMIDADGQFCGISPEYSYKTIELLKKCSLKIVMALSDAWHINKAEYFMTDDKWRGIISNDYIFLFDKEPPLKNKYSEMNMFNRNSQSFADEIARLFLC
jgi:hypothetical protein